MKNLYYIALLPAVLCSCSATNLMSLSVKEPAPITLSPNIKSIGVVNRSLPGEKSKVLDAVDKVFSLEGVNLDKEGSAASMSGLTNELRRNERFVEVKPLSSPPLGNNNPSSFPAPLPWDVVDRICRENKVQALFSLELFDTDSRINYAATPVKLNTPLGQIPGIEHQATMHTVVKTGWRIYDPVARVMLDEFAIARQIRYTGKGINPIAAAGALIGRKEAVKEVGNRAGQGYAMRVLPFWIRVSRYYYVRGNRSFKIAKRKARTGNWSQAGDLWYQQTTSPKRKAASRACYNMAIISEIEGDVDGAITWAQKSYEDYNNKLALRYVRALRDRKVSNLILQDQETQEIAGSGGWSVEP